MAKVLVDDALWELIAPHLPPPRARGPGRPRVPDRAALTGIIFVLRSGIPWEYLPQELGCGSGMTCWRRLHDWQAAGVWTRIRLAVLEGLHEAGQLDWSRAVVDSSSIRALKGGPRPGPTRRIAAARAASITSSPTRRGSRWWSRSLERMITTLPSSFPSSTASRPSAAGVGGPASGRRASRATGRTTRSRTRRS